MPIQSPVSAGAYPIIDPAWAGGYYGADMMRNKMQQAAANVLQTQLANKYYPTATMAHAASEAAYARMLGPQTAAALLGNSNYMAGQGNDTVNNLRSIAGNIQNGSPILIPLPGGGSVPAYPYAQQGNNASAMSNMQQPAQQPQGMPGGGAGGMAPAYPYATPGAANGMPQSSATGNAQMQPGQQQGAQQDAMSIPSLQARAAKEFPNNPTMQKLALAQAIQESRHKDGTFSKLATDYNNLFGIKGKGNAGSVDMYSPEQDKNGNTTLQKSTFAAYKTPEDAFAAYDKKMHLPMYRDVLNANDFPTAAAAVGKHWASDKKYAQNLGDALASVQQRSQPAAAQGAPAADNNVSAPLSYAQQVGQYQGTIASGQEAGKLRAHAIDDVGSDYQGLIQSSTPIKNLEQLYKNPDFQKMREMYPLLQTQQFQALAKLGTPAQQEMIGTFRTNANQTIADIVNMFKGKALEKEFNLASQMKINEGDTFAVGIGKLKAMDQLKQVAMQRDKIALDLMQNQQMPRYQAFAIADKQIQPDKIMDKISDDLNRMKDQKKYSLSIGNTSLSTSGASSSPSGNGGNTRVIRDRNGNPVTVTMQNGKWVHAA